MESKSRDSAPASVKTNIIDQGRRRFLLGASTALWTAGAVGVAIPFIGSWNPSARAKAAGAPVSVDISKIAEGNQVTVEWRGQPVWVLHRTKEMLANLPRLDSQLSDPDSKVISQQPDYADNPYRSIKPEFLVVIGICTHLGCSPSFRPEIAPGDLGTNWLGGYFCPCHGSRFDLAGRVYKSVPAPTNLVIPPHHYLTDDVIEIGIDPTTA